MAPHQDGLQPRPKRDHGLELADGAVALQRASVKARASGSCRVGSGTVAGWGSCRGRWRGPRRRHGLLMPLEAHGAAGLSFALGSLPPRQPNGQTPSARASCRSPLCLRRESCADRAPGLLIGFPRGERLSTFEQGWDTQMAGNRRWGKGPGARRRAGGLAWWVSAGGRFSGRGAGRAARDHHGDGEFHNRYGGDIGKGSWEVLKRQFESREPALAGSAAAARTVRARCGPAQCHLDRARHGAGAHAVPSRC